MRQPAQISLFALAPRRLGRLVGVAAAVDDFRHARAELPLDGLSGDCSALVLDGVVQQGGNGLVLVGPVLQHDAGHAKQVGDVRRAGKLAALRLVQPCGIDQGVGEAIGERHGPAAACPGWPPSYTLNSAHTGR